jgi:phosphoesterase RecJ-like protein
MLQKGTFAQNIFEMDNVLNEKIENSQKIVITSHQSPDGDAVGSSLALGHYLRDLGKDVTVILPDALPPFLKWMPGCSDILLFESSATTCAEHIENADMIFILDYNDLKRVGAMGENIGSSKAFKVMIDHHLHPSDCADHMISDTNVCSTAQMIYEFIEEHTTIDNITIDVAECIYVGLVTDSGSFRFPSVDGRTHEICAFLIDNGLNHASVHERLFDLNSLDKLHLLGYSLGEKLKVLPNIPVAVIYLTIDELNRFNNKKGYTEGLVNFALSCEGVSMAAFIKEDENKVKMSFRSKGDIAVNEFSSQYFNGGGHKNAAGGASFESFSETIEKFETVIYDFFKSTK